MTPSLRFEKKVLSLERYESAGVFDVDNDGVLDIVCGAYWYRGPDFQQKFKIGDVRAEGEYYDDFSTIAMDVNGDGFTDFITGGWWGNTLRWRENPLIKGDPAKTWNEHIIAEVGNVETTRAWDVDGDGQLEIVPNTPGGPQRFFKLITDNGKGAGKFKEFIAYPKQSGHGIGFGDVDNDGRGEIILHNGYLKAPADPLSGPWTFLPAFELGCASCSVIVADVNKDGVNDLIVGQAHGYGLDWYEQRIIGGQGGQSKWIKHPIDPYNSQYHDLIWTDLDGDGECELVTGKRFRAHCGRDPGEYDPPGIYYFKWNGESFSKQIIDYGPIGTGKGCGIHFQVVDIDGDGRKDIVAPGKDGLCLYRNLGTAPNLGC